MSTLSQINAAQIIGNTDLGQEVEGGKSWLDETDRQTDRASIKGVSRRTRQYHPCQDGRLRENGTYSLLGTKGQRWSGQDSFHVVADICLIAVRETLGLKNS